MGNSFGGSGRKRAKIMKMNGEMMKVKVPLRAIDVTKDHHGHVLLDSEAVKHFGLRAKPLEPQVDLKPKRVYFLVEIPRFIGDEDRRISSRRTQSVISMSAKERLECLMLSRRSASDLTLGPPGRPSPGPVRVRMRLPKAQMEKLLKESKDEIEVAEKIIGIYRTNGADVATVGGSEAGFLRRDDPKARQKRVSFLPIEGHIRFPEETSS